MTQVFIQSVASVKNTCIAQDAIPEFTPAVLFIIQQHV